MTKEVKLRVMLPKKKVKNIAEPIRSQDIRTLDDRIDKLEKLVKQQESRISALEFHSNDNPRVGGSDNDPDFQGW